MMAKRMKATGDCYDDAGRIVPAETRRRISAEWNESELVAATGTGMWRKGDSPVVLPTRAPSSSARPSISCIARAPNSVAVASSPGLLPAAKSQRIGSRGAVGGVAVTAASPNTSINRTELGMSASPLPAQAGATAARSRNTVVLYVRGRIMAAWG